MFIVQTKNVVSKYRHLQDNEPALNNPSRMTNNELQAFKLMIQAGMTKMELPGAAYTIVKD